MPKPVDEDALSVVAGSDWCHVIADYAIDGYLEYVAKQIEGPPDGVTALRRAARAFLADRAFMQPTYDALWRVSMFTRMEEQWASRRHYQLFRLIVGRFDHLLQRSGPLEAGAVVIDREALPGFLTALQTMAPGDYWEQARGRTEAIAEEKQAELGERFRWAHVERDEEANLIVDDLLMSIVPYFADYQKRREWFVGVVLRHQSAPDAPNHDGLPRQPRRIFDKIDFQAVMQALFKSLRERIAEPAQRRVLVERYGEERVRLLGVFLDNMARADDILVLDETAA